MNPLTRIARGVTHENVFWRVGWLYLSFALLFVPVAVASYCLLPEGVLRGKHPIIRALEFSPEVWLATLQIYAYNLIPTALIVAANLLAQRSRFAEDCRILKARLERDARAAGWTTKSSVPAGTQFTVLNCLAVEKLEAWFFGDVAAIHIIYPRVSIDLGARARHRDPDAIRGGTWEALERELQRGGYFGGGLPKIEVARAISAQMDPLRNRSHSFQVFHEGPLALCSTKPAKRVDVT